MKTCCPGCQTSFRVTPEQLKARAGKVRCGQCKLVFNALDSLVVETVPAPATVPLSPPAAMLTPPTTASLVASPFPSIELPASREPQPEELTKSRPETPPIALATPAASQPIMAPTAAEPASDDTPARPEATEPGQEEKPLSADEVQELAKASGLILPRDTTEIPGYSKWSEGAVSAPLAMPAETTARWPFTLVSLLLALSLAGQLVFHFRSELAIALPSLRPALATFAGAFGKDIPLPRQPDLVSIETSDLQSDPAHGNLLLLNATLRNRASFAQAYPHIEISLTDTQDDAIARRVFRPDEYLPAKTPSAQPFAANADVAIRLWIEAKDITASGYRLYVFYP